MSYGRKLISQDSEARQTEVAMTILQDMVPAALDAAGPQVRARFDNALLNVAVHRILDVEGEQVTATILMRLADARMSGQVPKPGCAIDLTSLDA